MTTKENISDKIDDLLIMAGISVKSSRDNLTTQILTLLESVVPEEKEHLKDCWSLEDTGNNSKYCCDCGIAEYNLCREEMLRRVR
jgi:hypothetical protein